MYKKIWALYFICSLCAMLTACGPSEEKVAEAQQKYEQLVEVHNQVVEAHKEITDDSLDTSLTEIREQISEIETYNLADMKDEEIDALIGTMDSLIESYESVLETLSDIKADEDAAVLVPIPIAVTNNTSFSFSSLKLYEKGNYSAHEDVLEDMGLLEPLQTLTGLVVLRDVDNTPWILTLSDTDGNEYEFELPVSEYEEEGVTLKLLFDSAETGLSIEYT